MRSAIVEAVSKLGNPVVVERRSPPYVVVSGIARRVRTGGAVRENITGCAWEGLPQVEQPQARTLGALATARSRVVPDAAPPWRSRSPSPSPRAVRGRSPTRGCRSPRRSRALEQRPLELSASVRAGDERGRDRPDRHRRDAARGRSSPRTWCSPRTTASRRGTTTAGRCAAIRTSRGASRSSSGATTCRGAT